MIRWITVFLIVFLVGCGSSPKKPDDGIDTQTRERVEQWKSLIDSGSQWSDIKKLTKVNDFVNQFEFVDDIEHWQQEDYWATPLQTLVTQGGDCEDFSIAKYFTLSAMGMEKEKLRLTYVKSLTLNQAHMVVSYFEKPRAEPLVLDNINPRIAPASQRQDLLPVYSFNGDGLWLSKRGRTEQQIDDSSRISLWQQLLHHMDVEAADEDAMICLYQHYDLPESTAKTMCP
ncbi:MAG: transglutaminase-like cysteine peptidase [Proteobacteria bacterium]|nr:transglutaminase-like cysteine peptidase [Pseudomonadota bacterium]